MSTYSSILLYVLSSVIISGLPRSQVRHLYSTPACPIIHSSILVIYVVRSVSISGLPRSQVRNLYSTPACPVIHLSILVFYVVRSVSIKWFATFTTATPIFNPCTSSHSFIHPCLLCGSLS